MSSRNRSLTLAGSFCVVFLVLPLVSGNSCENTSFHPEKKGQYSHHHVIDTMTTETVSLCRIMCYLQESCMSYNYQLSTGSCELSDSDETIDGQIYELISSSDHIYVRRKNPCEKSPCPHNKDCKPNFKDGSHSCLCPHGFQGSNCTEDIDECVTGKHDCPSDSNCINTRGFFICEKKNGEANISSDGLEDSTILTIYGNSSYFEALSGFLAPVLKNSSTSRWVRCWHAASDGWNVRTKFHPKCDRKGPTVTIIRVGKYVFGGYSDVSWHSNGYQTYFWTSESFLFSLFNIHGYEPIKLGLREKRSRQILFGSKSLGPSFNFDLQVSRRWAYTRCETYKCPPVCLTTYNRYCSFFTGHNTWFKIKDVEVFFRQANA